MVALSCLADILRDAVGTGLRHARRIEHLQAGRRPGYPARLVLTVGAKDLMA